MDPTHVVLLPCASLQQKTTPHTQNSTAPPSASAAPPAFLPSHGAASCSPPEIGKSSNDSCAASSICRPTPTDHVADVCVPVDLSYFQLPCTACEQPVTWDIRPLKGRRCQPCVNARRPALSKKPTRAKKRSVFNFHARNDTDMLADDSDDAAAAPATAAAAADAVSASESSQSSSSSFSAHVGDNIDDDNDAAMLLSSDASAPPAAVASAAAAAAHAAPIPWTLAEPLPLHTSSAPLEHFIHDFLSCFLLYGFCLIRADLVRATISARLAALRSTAPAESITPINGNVAMIDVASHPSADIDSLMDEWDKAILALAAPLPLKDSSRNVSTRKLLVAEEGLGQQVLHWDEWKGPDVDPNTTSVITMCSQGMSTVVPRFPLAAFTPKMNSPASLKKFAYLLEPEWFHSVPVGPGDVLIFSQRIPHWGPKNLAADARLAAFCMLSAVPEEKPGSKPQDSFQV